MSELPPQPSPEAADWFVSFGLRLRAARERRGMQQAQASEQLGLPARSLRRWESGLADPGIERTLRMAEFYGVSVDWLLGRTEVRSCVQKGLVMVDEEAVATIHRLVALGRGLTDVPAALIRHPGLQYATQVPAKATFVPMTEARELEARLRTLIDRLRRNSAQHPSAVAMRDDLRAGPVSPSGAASDVRCESVPGRVDADREQPAEGMPMVRRGDER